MSKQTLAVAVGAAILFAVALMGALAFTGDGSSGSNVHTVQDDGQTMTGTGGMHTMQNGHMMPGMTHTSP